LEIEMSGNSRRSMSHTAPIVILRGRSPKGLSRRIESARDPGVSMLA
jgi:hypothetical protein